MIGKIIFFAIFAVAFAQEGDDKGYSDMEILKRLTDEGIAALEETSANIINAPKKFDQFIEDRLNSLNWEGVVQKQNLNKSITEAVFKGMFKNKQFSNFQCISNGAQDTENKLEAITSQISVNSDKLKEKELSGVMRYRLIMNGFHFYIQDLFKTKSEELSKAGNEDVKKKILEEVVRKMKLLNSVLEQINGRLKDVLFIFFEKYVLYAFETEKMLINTQREGAKTIMKCVS